MAKFKFAFESLKKLRANKLLLARRDMMECDAKLRALLDEHRQAAVLRADLFDDRSAEIGTKLTVSKLQMSMDLVESQTKKLRLLEKHILTFQGEFERHRNWVAHLGRELKIVEKLEENKRNQFEADQRLKDKRQADRWVAERWALKLNGSEGETGLK